METRYHAGQLAPWAGDYELLTSDGERTGVYRRGLKGKPLPPTPARGQSYVFVARRSRRR